MTDTYASDGFRFPSLSHVELSGKLAAVKYQTLPLTSATVPVRSVPVSDLSILTACCILVGIVLACLLGWRLDEGELTSSRSMVATGILSLALLCITANRSLKLFKLSKVAHLGEGHARSYTDVLAVYALNILAISMTYTFAATVDPHTISHTNPNSSAVEIFLESLYDVTLVASGTGFGQRVPLTWFPKLIMGICAGYLTIGLTMTVFTRILASSLMYMDTRIKK